MLYNVKILANYQDLRSRISHRVGSFIFLRDLKQLFKINYHLSKMPREGMGIVEQHGGHYTIVSYEPVFGGSARVWVTEFRIDGTQSQWRQCREEDIRAWLQPCSNSLSEIALARCEQQRLI